MGVPSCQTDWLFTNDPVNQKSPSKALSSYERVTALNPWERVGLWWEGGKVGVELGKENWNWPKAMEHRTPSSVLWWPALTAVSPLLTSSRVRVPRHAARLSWDTVIGQNDTWPRLFRAGIFISRKSLSQLLPFFHLVCFPWTGFWTSPLRTIIQWTEILVEGDFRQLFGPEKNWLPSHPCAFWSNVPLPAFSDPGKCF